MNMHVEVSSYEVFVEARKDMDKSVFFGENKHQYPFWCEYLKWNKTNYIYFLNAEAHMWRVSIVGKFGKILYI